jgi:type VI secretion system secreted protein Hcp
MANVDYFLKVDGIEGESKSDKHKGEIDVESFSFGATQSGTFATGGGGGAGRVSMQDFHFVMQVNKASPKLMLACATGQHIPKATLSCQKAGKEQQEYLKITLSDLLVSSYQIGGSSGDLIPTDQVSLNFSKVEYEYKEQQATGQTGGTVKASFDVKAAKGS